MNKIVFNKRVLKNKNQNILIAPANYSKISIIEQSASTVQNKSNFLISRLIIQ